MGSKLTDLTRVTTADTGDLFYIVQTVGDTGASRAISRKSLDSQWAVQLSRATDTGKYLADTGQFVSDTGFALSDSIITTLGRNLIDDTGQTAMRTTLGLGTAAVKNTGTSGNTVPLLDGANTWSGEQIFDAAATRIRYTNDGQFGPDLQFHHLSASPIAGDVLGRAFWFGNNSLGVLTAYTTILATLNNPTSGSEAAGYGFWNMQAGVLANRMQVDAGVYHPSATGGDKGSNTINFGAYFVNNVPVPERIFATVQGTAVALTNNITTAQNIFAAANDTLTVAASTTYRFRAVIQLNTGATSHTTSFGFGGTATITSCHYRAKSTSSAADTLATPQARRVSVATAVVLTAASTAVTTDIEIEGIIRINAGGTLIPQITFSAGPTGTCEVAVDSFIEFMPIGSNTVAAAGLWA